jgi:hypothetical protein
MRLFPHWYEYAQESGSASVGMVLDGKRETGDRYCAETRRATRNSAKLPHRRASAGHYDNTTTHNALYQHVHRLISKDTARHSAITLWQPCLLYYTSQISL